jgi:hypothetical protein
LDTALEPIRNAQWFHGEAESELARLYVIFPDPTAAQLAEAAGTAMQNWIDALKDVLKPANSDEYASAVTRAHFAASEAKIARERLLREMNRQIRSEGQLNPFRSRLLEHPLHGLDTGK